jgi:CheY-like chemotaxis protein
MHENPIIMIVEDCPVTAAVFERVILSTLPHCRPMWARDLQDARLRSSGLPVALFVMDINLPDGSGLDFLWEMSTVQPHAQAIVISSTPLPEYQAQSAALGALRFVEKPVTPPEVQELMTDVLNSSITSGSDAFRASLRNLTIFDILQLKCLAGATTTLEFASNGRVGQIHIYEGSVIHAELGEETGVTAIENIARWRDGTARELPFNLSTPYTIDQSWQSLFMHIAHAIDEQANGDA